MDIRPSQCSPGVFTYDDVVRAHYKRGERGAVVGWLLMASYGYYIKCSESSLLSDRCFDNAAKWLLENYDEVNHKYKHLLTKDGLKAGSMYYIPAKDYPAGLVQQAEVLLKKLFMEESNGRYRPAVE